MVASVRLTNLLANQNHAARLVSQLCKLRGDIPYRQMLTRRSPLLQPRCQVLIGGSLADFDFDVNDTLT